MSKHAAPAVPTAKVERKVWAATAATFATSGALAVLNDLQVHPELLGDLPRVVQTVLILFGPPLATFLSGYAAKHTPRDEQPQG